MRMSGAPRGGRRRELSHAAPARLRRRDAAVALAARRGRLASTHRAAGRAAPAARRDAGTRRHRRSVARKCGRLGAIAESCPFAGQRQRAFAVPCAARPTSARSCSIGRAMPCARPACRCSSFRTASGRILSSGHFRNEFDRLDAGAAAAARAFGRSRHGRLGASAGRAVPRARA